MPYALRRRSPAPSPRPDDAGPLLRRLRPVHLLLAVAVVAALAPLSRLLTPAPFVPRLAFENPTGYDLGVEVSDEARKEWLGLGTAGRNGTTVVADVYDVGDVWVFRLRAQGREGGEVRLTRSELRHDGWTVRLPRSVGQQLEAGGAPPP